MPRAGEKVERKVPGEGSSGGKGSDARDSGYDFPSDPDGSCKENRKVVVGGGSLLGVGELTRKVLHNREGWLTALARMMEESVFGGYELAKYRVTMGWPSTRGTSPTKRVLGECHSHVTSKDGWHELFISPVLDDPNEVAGVLAHEAAHVVAGVEAKHGPGFKKVCRHVGLTLGKPTSVMPGEMLAERIRRMMEPLGPYPHQAIVPAARKIKLARKRVTLACGGCGVKASMALEDVDGVGVPTCGCGGVFQIKIKEGG